MSLRSLFEEELKPDQSPLDVWAASLSEKDRADLMEFAAHPGLSHSAFHRIVKSKGVAVGKDSVTGWRKAHGFPRS